MIAAIFFSSGVIWMANSYWHFKTQKPEIGVLYLVVGLLNIAVGALLAGTTS